MQAVNSRFIQSFSHQVVEKVSYLNVTITIKSGEEEEENIKLYFIMKCELPETALKIN